MKTLIVYAHLLAACAAVGILLIQDFSLARTFGKPLSNSAILELRKSIDVALVSLVVLWITGLLLVFAGYLENPNYFANQKLWGKISVVVVLTLNGFFLHEYTFPRVISPEGVIGLYRPEKILVILSGSVSSVSWLFACYLGIARPWNGTVKYGYVMSVYLALILIAFVVGCELLRTKRRTNLTPSTPTRSIYSSADLPSTK